VAILLLRQIYPLVRKSRRDSPNRCVYLDKSTFKRGSDLGPNHSLLHRLFSSNLLCSPQSSALAVAASHKHLFLPSVTNENEFCKLIKSYFLLDPKVLQWHPATGEDIPTPNTNEIVVFASFFQRRFGLLFFDFLHGLLDYYQIELVHLNPNSILHIVIFVHLCEAYLGIPLYIPLFKNCFFLKYQPSVTNRKVISGVGLQTHPHAGFMDSPLKNSL
jgi:hypothetical protein